jgi:hypothetical protein
MPVTEFGVPATKLMLASMSAKAIAVLFDCTTNSDCGSVFRSATASLPCVVPGQTSTRPCGRPKC